METEGSLAQAIRKPTLTPKAIIHQKFGSKTSYTLPDFTVVSESFKKKKDAEQSAAQMALKKLGIKPSADSPTAEETWRELIARIKYIFSDEFLSVLHPLSSDFKEDLRRIGDLNGSVPASVIAICDGKPNNLCKIINPTVESDPFLAVEPVILNISTAGYYLDAIAQKLGLSDGNMVFISRNVETVINGNSAAWTIGKASSETRIYFAAPKSYLLDKSSDLLNAKAITLGGTLNARATYICGQDIYGDSILASIGYTWKGQDLFHEDVTLQSYDRMLISKIPSGVYKLSREAILAAELPLTFTTRTNWKASSESSRSNKKPEVPESAEQEREYVSGNGSVDAKSVGFGSSFTCENGTLVGKDPESYCVVENDASSVNIEGPDSGLCPSNGSLSCVCDSLSLVTKGELQKELLESIEEFEFEMGTGAVIPCLEAVVSQMSVGQSACFYTELPPEDLVLAAAKDSENALAFLSSPCCLEYSIILLQVTEPPEDRMEQALFSPPLPKQRIEYAVQQIKQSCVTSLVDFGCGSGSLLESLLEYPTSLETIAGVDISQKSLSRAAKVLHSKLVMQSDPDAPCRSIKSAILYDGSITEFDSRLCGFDLGTCLEVIEHMEEDQASLFGNIALSSFRPRILIVGPGTGICYTDCCL
ncbi:Double-stranded RNA binding protein-related / DsRBD protein-related, putative isoform 2 [Hibiscus syriacus]|uniref:Small RNA 2'-O-methyltransferase n=1 Tax=Hibiscus syriacus TaxID=106335 RepID=A0A6A3D1T8_HIBSY|nr:Double-stranded RNA binding protein-related / DsRBD protein-related, putative isoform 2 [Hibiscus syriacus]